MAFNFNWSPLTTDASFYTRAQELLTTALNKSPRPPIIVDDIIVNELNLGHVPPELEILEIGDLAEDRFRGIFKMSYNGDAFLTLKTRVQANPLNTYLSTRPSFASPQPLAAATGLTIPLQITLSDIKLSAFIVLVFSKQKGLTLVFRNDPLESLKVSSTFDSIPFVRDYLQKEIDGQLRILLMDQLPAIIHRLSLRLWVPEYRAKEDQELAERKQNATEEPVIDPFASPPQDPVDSTGNPLSPSEVASLSLDSSVETQSLFSQKNLLRLAALNDSHRTLSLFTPAMRETVFRAWSGTPDRGDVTGVQSPMAPSLSRSQSYAASTSTTYTFPDHSSVTGRSHLGTGLSMGPARHSKPHRKRKKRVVNLRKKPEGSGDGESVMSGDTESYTTESYTESMNSSEVSGASVFSPAEAVREESIGEDGEPMTPALSPVATLKPNKNLAAQNVSSFRKPSQPRKTLAGAFEPPTEESARHYIHQHEESDNLGVPRLDLDATPRASVVFSPEKPSLDNASAHASLQNVLSESAGPSSRVHHSRKNDHANHPVAGPSTTTAATTSASSHLPTEPVAATQSQPLPAFLQFLDPGNSASIAEQAWMMKMANEIARRYQIEKERMEHQDHKGNMGESSANKVVDGPPPAYAV